MTDEEYVKDHLRDIARYIDGEIPMEHGFILLVFPFGPGGVIQYIANCDRSDAVQAMREWIAMTTGETVWTDSANAGKEGFEAWLEQQLVRHAGEAAGPELQSQLLYDAWVAGRASK
jgi:hypothetical protein